MDASSGPARAPERQGGFRSQPLWLRVVLVVSLLALASGIVLCSFEATAPPVSVRAEGT
jgi:hypothetical protein